MLTNTSTLAGLNNNLGDFKFRADARSGFSLQTEKVGGFRNVASVKGAFRLTNCAVQAVDRSGRDLAQHASFWGQEFLRCRFSGYAYLDDKTLCLADAVLPHTPQCFGESSLWNFGSFIYILETE